MDGSIEHRAGAVALIGLPNAGKSTLMNQIIEHKVSIVSSKPQTTRNRILGVLSREDVQIAFVDTPGIHQPKGRLHRIMVRAAEEIIPEVDVVCWVVDALALSKRRSRSKELIHGGVKHLCNLLSNQKRLVVILNKIDAVKKSNLLPMFSAFGENLPQAEIFPVSAKSGDNCNEFIELLRSLLPESPRLFPPHHLTDVSERFLVAELIREKIFQLTNQEIPYSVAVEIERFVERETTERKSESSDQNNTEINSDHHDENIDQSYLGQGILTEDSQLTQANDSESQETHLLQTSNSSNQSAQNNDDLIDQFLSAPDLSLEHKRGVIEIFARIWVERSSQKGIIIGKQGSKLKEIMTRARGEIELLLGTRVWIDAHVSVLERWSDDPRRLKQLGYE